MRKYFHMLPSVHRLLQIILLLVIATLVACNRSSLPNVELSSFGNMPLEVLNESGVKFLIEETGVYRLTLKQLQQAGLSIDALSAENLNLSNLGNDVPYLLADDALIFYNEYENTTNPIADFNDDGFVDSVDYNHLATVLKDQPPGPSGLDSDGDGIATHLDNCKWV